MSKTEILTALPYILIVVANILYLYSRGLDQSLQWFELFVYNFLIMVVAGIYIILHINILLHKWLIQQSGKLSADPSGTTETAETDKQAKKVTMKQVLQKKVSDFLEMRYFITNCFNYGNQEFLVKIYLGIVVFKWVLSLLPGVFVGLMFFLYYQYKKKIDKKLEPLIKKANKLYEKVKRKVLLTVPKHKKVYTNPIEEMKQQPNEQKEEIKDNVTEANDQQKKL